ncbi:hypothetical protein OMD46_03390 [Pseudomonas sp. MDMC_285]|nr:hypothetical protein [Pseudomonas sp. MDMC_285]
MSSKPRLLLAFLLAVLLASLLASIFQTQTNLAALQALGARCRWMCALAPPASI